MGLFKRSSKGRPEYLNVDLTDFNVKWDSFSTALPSILDTGSQDVKKSEFKLPSGTYMVFTHNGRVKSVLPPSSRFTVKEYLQYVKEEDLPPETREKLTEVSASDDLYRYDVLCKAVPEAKDFLTKLFYSLNLETAVRLDGAMRGESIQVSTEPVFSESLEHSILSWDFFDKTSDDTLKAVDLLKLRQEHAVERMELTHLMTAPLQVLEEWEAASPEDSYLQRQAREGASIQTLLSGAADGLLSSTLLESLERLLLQKKMNVAGRVVKEEEELPDFEAMMADPPAEVPEESSEEEAVLATCGISESESAFTEVEPVKLPDGVEEDDEWAFEEEILDGEDDRPHFVPTGFLQINLRPLVYPLIKEYELDPDAKRKVRAHLRENSRLEKEVRAVEERIEPLSNNYSHGIEVYDEMKFTKSLDDLKNDGEDPTEAEVESVENAPAMVEQRDESNEDFFTLAKLEEERHRLNEARKKELYGLLGSVPFEGEDSRTIELQDIIEAKLRGIGHVKTIAFHPPLDVSNHNKLVAELVNDDAMLGVDNELPEVEPVDEEEEVKEDVEENKHFIDIDAPDPREGSHAFIYYELVDEWGVDPIELYKEDMRIKSDGGNPYAPRATKYSRHLNEAWEKLQASEADEKNDESREE